MKPILYNFSIIEDTKTIQVKSTEKLQSFISGLKIKKGLENKIYLLCSLIFYNSLINKIKSDFVSIHSKTLEKLFGSSYKDLIDFCFQNKIIKIDNFYKKFAEHPLTYQTKKYKLNNKFYDANLFDIQFEDIKIYKRLIKIKSLQTKRDNETGTVKTFKPYKETIKDKIIEIFSESQNYFESNTSKQIRLKEIENKKKQPILKSEIISDDNEQFSNMYRYLNEISFDVKNAREFIDKNKKEFKENTLFQMNAVCDYFENNEKRFIKRDREGRITTLITRMKKELLQFVKHDTIKRLIIGDVKNFQPFILNMFVDQMKLYNKKDSIHWNKLTSEGLIYEHLTYLFNKTYNPKKPITRDKIKSQLVSILNGPIKDDTTYKKSKTPLFRLLKNKFPSIIHTLNTIKECDYKKMSNKLHCAESLIMIDAIATSYSKKYFVLTIHDAVIIDYKDLRKFKKYFYSWFDKFSPFAKPRIKITNLSGKELNDYTIKKPKKNSLARLIFDYDEDKRYALIKSEDGIIK